MPASRIPYTERAEQQVEALFRHYEELSRFEAANNLARALEDAEQRIATKPEAGLPAPRPYPKLAAPGEAWIKVGRYWIAYRVAPSPVILAVFHESANIPGRL